jgi:hypothetical protein
MGTRNVRHPYDEYVTGRAAKRLTGPAADYLADLRASNCPRCGRGQYTKRGEPMVCPACIEAADMVERPSMPMGMKTRRGRKV